MDETESKQSRVTNMAIQSQLVELSVRFTRMERDIQEIKKTLLASEERVTVMEKKEAGQRPLLERRLEVLEKLTDKHEAEIDDLAKTAQSLASTVRTLTWALGIIGTGALSWLVTQILSLIK